MHQGGVGKNDEMCGAYISYYPKIDLVTCSSVPVEQSEWWKDIVDLFSFDFLALLSKYKKSKFEEVYDYVTNVSYLTFN